MAIDKNGTVYGTTEYGGPGPAVANGVIWALTPAAGGGTASLQVITELVGYTGRPGKPVSDIANPLYEVLLSKSGHVITVVGTGQIGTLPNQQPTEGSVLSVSPEDQSFTVLSKAFASSGHQSGPETPNTALRADADGNLYGAAQQYYNRKTNESTPAVIYMIQD